MPVAIADAFRIINVQPDNISVEAEQVGDTLTLVAGSGISLVANAASDQITIINTGSGGGGGGTTYITNNVENPYSFNVAGDDSTQRIIHNGETIKFTGSNGITTSSDTEGNITIVGPGSNPTFTNVTVTGQIIEPFNTYSTAISGTPNITFNCATGNIWRVTSSASSAWNALFTNVAITTGQATNITMIITQGATAHIPASVSINGTGTTVTWQGGLTPTGNANKEDIIAYSVMQTGLTTYVVYGQLVSFG